MEMEIELELGECGEGMILEKVVCNHGFFMMPPNCWIPSTQTFQRPLRLTSSKSVLVSISQPPPPNSNRLLLRLHDLDDGPLSFADQQFILHQVKRMLRISHKDQKDVSNFQKLHNEAKQKSFGRMFRSPSLFEDAVKSVLLCHCTWKRSLEMATALCQLQIEINRKQQLIGSEKSNCELGGGTFKCKRRRKWGKTKARGRKKRSKPSSSVAAANSSTRTSIGGRNKEKLLHDKEDERRVGDFPTPKELVEIEEEVLKKKCNMGYRAATILSLANFFLVNGGKAKEEDEEAFTYLVHEKVNGLGTFSLATLLMCAGVYENIGVDSETVRHLSEYHGLGGDQSITINSALPIVKRFYAKYSPFQYLAYWYEVVDYYESKLGSLSMLAPSSYHLVSGCLRNN